MQYDFVVYEKFTKEIISIILDSNENPKFLINQDYVGLCIPHKDYSIRREETGRCYFENENEKIIWLDDYRAKYEE